MKEQEQINLLREKLRDKRRRLLSWKLYKIKDKTWKIIPFIPNEHQLDYYNNKHVLNIIPKARQLWLSTMIQLDYFDDFLFWRNLNCCVIADTEQNATTIFRDKIQIAWDNLPDWLKSYYKVNTQKANEISIENTWSRFFVRNSVLWASIQRLHISEFWKICAKYPLNAQEIIRWALQTVWVWQQITIESTARWWEWYFYDMCKTAKELKEKWTELSQMDYKLFFYPWFVDKNYKIEWNILLPQDIVEYFDWLEKEHWIILSQEQKNFYYLKKKTLWEDIYSEYPTIFEESFMIALDWNYFDKELRLARTQKRITKVNYDPALPVNTVWDLWGAWWWDDTFIWFYQQYGSEIRIIDCWEWNRMSLIEIINQVIKTKPYRYWKHYWPHDMKVTEYSTWESRRETAKRNWVEFYVLDRWTVSDQINNTRQLFPQMYFDEEKTLIWVNHLNFYRRAWNETHWIWLDREEHNQHSHCWAAFRYLWTAVSLDQFKTNNEAEIITMNWNI